MPAGVELFNSVQNQLGSPALYSDVFANRPAFGFTGRLFISTDTNEIYRDTGTSWVLISGGGSPVNIYNSDGSLTAARTVTMAGFDLTFEGGASVNRIIQSANNNVARIFSWRTAGVQRWAIRVDGNETGSNAGANFAVRAYNDAGTFIFAPLSISRRTGEIETFAEESITTGGGSIIGLYTNSTGTYAGGLTTTGGNPQSSNFNIYTLATAGSVTFANSNLVGTTVNVLRAQVQNAGTITFPPGASGGLRAATNFVSQLQYNTLSAAATYTRMANVHLQGVYEVSGGNTFTITNAHQLLINALNENAYPGAQLTITNRWGIYQDGASDNNYFAGVMQLGSTTSTGEQLQVTGTARVTQSAYLATASGNVGIGTTSPAQKFVVSNAGSEGIEVVPALSANSNLIQSYNRGTSAYNTLLSRASEYNFQISTTSAMFINSSGNVGIGTTSPTSVSGYTSLTINNTTTGALIDLMRNNSIISRIYANNSEMFIGTTIATYLQIATNNTERMRITSGGFVGIGATSPLSNLSIYSTTYGTPTGTNKGTIGIEFGNTNGISIGTVNASPFANYIQSIDNRPTQLNTYPFAINPIGGNVLIGTTTDAGQRLQVNGAIAATNGVFSNPANNAILIQRGDASANFHTLGTDSGSGFVFDTAGSSSNYQIRVNGTERVRISVDGNIGFTQTTFGTSATRTLAISSGTAPASSPADCFQLYSADITAGNAAAHFRTEGGAVVKIYQQTTGVGTAARVGGGGTNVTDTDTFGGYTIGQIVQALQNAGWLA